jgi:hypothetical protein
LCALSRVSKRLAKVAEDVLYRNVDIQEGYTDPGLEYDLSNLSRFRWTISCKPYLATKVKDLTWWPRCKQVQYYRVIPSSTSDTSVPVTITELELAAELLSRFTELQSMTFNLNNWEFVGEEQDPWECQISKRIFPYLQHLTLVPGLAKIETISLSYGELGWPVLTLPSLKHVFLGTAARLEPPKPSYPAAPNITTLTLCFTKSNYTDLASLLRRMTNLKILVLASYGGVFHSSGHCSVDDIYLALDAARTIEDLHVTCKAQPICLDFTYQRLNLHQYRGLQRLEMAEIAFVGGPLTVVRPIQSPVEMLPPSLRYLVITHPNSRFRRRGRLEAPQTRILGWLEGLREADFPELHHIEVVCSRKCGHQERNIINAAYGASAIMQELRAAGVKVAITYDGA